MRKIFKDESTLKKCKIAQMLLSQPPHISFHTPGHKTAGWDVTELDYTDNLSAPNGCIAEAEKDIAEILGAHKSFILTDGSTSGVLSMLYAAKSLGVKRILTCESAHKSVFNGCAALEEVILPEKMVSFNCGSFSGCGKRCRHSCKSASDNCHIVFLHNHSTSFTVILAYCGC